AEIFGGIGVDRLLDEQELEITADAGDRAGDRARRQSGGHELARERLEIPPLQAFRRTSLRLRVRRQRPEIAGVAAQRVRRHAPDVARGVEIHVDRGGVLYVTPARIDAAAATQETGAARTGRPTMPSASDGPDG